MKATPAYVIGLDGGGTKTAAQLADLNGTVLAEMHGGPSNFQIVGVEEAARTILDLVETCCHSVGCSVSDIGSLVAGLAGAGRPVDQQRMAEGIQNAAQKRGAYVRDVSVESDARIALEAAFLGKPGIVLICGTGSITFGKDDRGHISRAGGWGRIIENEGSGYFIGREAIRAVARMIDGRGKKTHLKGLLASRFGLKGHEDIIRSVYRENFDLASLAPTVLHAAERRDGVARDILDTAAHESLESMKAVFKALKRPGQRRRDPIPLVFAGGLLESENVFSKRVKALVRKYLPGITLVPPSAQPVHGAVLMALARLRTEFNRAKPS